jgi:hypothetical protein
MVRTVAVKAISAWGLEAAPAMTVHDFRERAFETREEICADLSLGLEAGAAQETKQEGLLRLLCFTQSSQRIGPLLSKDAQEP